MLLLSYYYPVVVLKPLFFMKKVCLEKKILQQHARSDKNVKICKLLVIMLGNIS